MESAGRLKLEEEGATSATTQTAGALAKKGHSAETTARNAWQLYFRLTLRIQRALRIGT